MRTLVKSLNLAIAFLMIFSATFSTQALAQTATALTVNLNVDATSNVNPFEDEMLGMALVNWEHSWGKPFPNQVPGLSQAFDAANIGIIRYAGGNWVNSVGWQRTNQITPYTNWTTNGNTYSFHYGIDEINSLAAFAQSIDSPVMMQINIDEYDPEMWADLVSYTNIEQNYLLSDGSKVFKYWEVGNEFNLGVWDGSTPSMTPTEYVNRLPGYISAMKSVDPSIKIITGVPAGAHGSPFTHNWDDNYTDLSEYLSLSAQVSGADSISYHWYMNGNNQSIEDMFAFEEVYFDPPMSFNWRHSGTRAWSRIIPNRIDSEIILNSELTQGVTELNYDSSDFGIAPQNANHVNAIWAADVIGRLAYNGTDYLTWYEGYGTPNQGYPAISGNDPNGYPTAINLRPSYYTFFMYGNYFGDQMIESVSSDESRLSIWASTDSMDPGKLKLMVVNTHSTEITAPISISGFTSNTAEIYEMVSSNPTSMSDQSHDNHLTTINGVTLDSMNVASSASTIIPETQTYSANTLTRDFPPYSVTSIILINGVMSEAPSITLTDPLGTENSTSSSYTIKWIDDDNDDNAIIDLYWDSDSSYYNGATAIAVCQDILEDDEQDECSFDTRSINAEYIYIHGCISDGSNIPVCSTSGVLQLLDHMGYYAGYYRFQLIKKRDRYQGVVSVARRYASNLSALQ